MKAFSTCPLNRLKPIRGVFTDIDDTLTTEGRVTAQAYQAMECLQDHGMLVIPITGRPAGWCDAIARTWPVDGVIGENGAFYFRYDVEKRQMIRHFIDDETARGDKRQKLKMVAQNILHSVPGAGLSADQNYRETDLAIDFCEDVPPLPREKVDQIVTIMQEAGMTAKVSSIHVNGWFGHYDKMIMARIFAKECFGLDLEICQRDFVFTGDSPNDGPMFSYFENSIGVANVQDFQDRLVHPPTYVTQGRGGAGFAEVVEALVAAKDQKITRS